MNTTQSFRALTPVKEFIEEMGFAISYAYEDLVFIDNNAFMVRFNDLKASSLFIHFCNDYSAEVKSNLKIRLLNISKRKGLFLEFKQDFEIAESSVEGEVELRFVN